MEAALESDSAEEEERLDEMEDLLDVQAVIASSRFVNQPCRIPKMDGFSGFLASLPDDEFRQAVRMIKRGSVLDLIKDDMIFQTKSYVPQKPVSVQLSIALERFGLNGTSASVGGIARLYGVGNGTVTNMFNESSLHY